MPLDSRHRGALTAHLLSLATDDRADRFIGTVSDDYVTRYVDAIGYARDILIGAVRERRLVGLAHAAVYLEHGELISEVGAIVAWLESVADSDLHLSAVTMGEIQAGIELTRDQGAAKADEIEQWANLVATSWNVLSMNVEIFREWARLMHRRSDTLYEDAMIAATARLHKLTVVTRNVRDFSHLGVELFNPFKSKSG